MSKWIGFFNASTFKKVLGTVLVGRDWLRGDAGIADEAKTAESQDQCQNGGPLAKLSEKHGTHHAIGQSHGVRRRQPTAGKGARGLDRVGDQRRRHARRRRLLGHDRRQRPGRQHHAPTRQTIRQHHSATGQSAVDRPFRNAERLRGLLARLAFQIAQDDGHAILLVELIQLVIEQGLQINPEVVRRSTFFIRRGHGHFSLLTLLRGGPGANRGLIGDAVQPIADQLARPNRGRLANENQERRLKGILGIVEIAEHAQAYAEHHRTVAAHQQLERPFLLATEEGVQQLPIA
ncbi:MAG: hypothetical protein HYR84_09315 [Planctomycetes bacterium]|nr:hypothetical protein [Planctomycetota bacterium]